MEKRLPPSSRIQKTTILFVIALAILGAVGAMTAMMTSATQADAAICRNLNTPVGAATICPREPDFRICPPLQHCIDTRPG